MPPESKPLVLVVDDNDDARTSLSFLLRLQNYLVEEAGTAREAIQLAGHRTDLIVLDVILPDQNGNEVCRQLKADPATSTTPVLMLSGQAVEDEDRIAGLEGGADVYLTKPVEPAILLAQVKALLRIRRVEKDLAEREERFRLLAKATGDAVWDWDMRTDHIWWGEGLQPLSGFDPEDKTFEIGWWADHLHPDDRPRVLAELNRALAGGQNYATEYRFRRRDGSFAHVGSRGYVLRDDDDRPTRMIGAMQDFTERRKAAIERDKLLARLQLHIERMPLAYVLLAPDFRIIDWNPAAQRIFGYDKAEALQMGSAFDRLVPPSTRAEVEAALNRVAAGDMPGHVLNENLTRDGRTITCEWHNTALMTGDGQFGGIFCLAQDVTDRIHLEEQLRQAQKMEAVGRLAGGIAHDFNNLLTIINGYSDLLLQSLAAEDPTREIVGEIRLAGERSAGLTRQLLAFGRKQVIAPKVLDLNMIIRDTQRILRRGISEDIRLITRLSDEPATVRADSVQLEQVLMNLVVNARDASPRGGTVTIETGFVENEIRDSSHPAGRYVILSVSDNGTGMSEEVQARLFEPFFTTKEVGKGTGLGLAVVHGIVTQSDGRIFVDSESGRGTTIRIHLPWAGQAASTVKKQPEIRSVSLGNETVLLVEDEKAVREMARKQLQDAGYLVLSARNGEEALKVAAEHPGSINLLATDVVMPGMGGRDLAERLIVERPDIRVLYMSGHTEDEVVRHGVKSNMLNFLQKPFSPEDLARKIRETLDQ